jgi:hypothetical protein
MSKLLIPSCTTSWTVGNSSQVHLVVDLRFLPISFTLNLTEPHKKDPSVYTQLLVVDILNPVEKSLIKVSRRIKLRLEKCVVVWVNVFQTCVHAHSCYEMCVIMFPNTFQIEFHPVWTYDAPAIYLILFAQSYTLRAMLGQLNSQRND